MGFFGFLGKVGKTIGKVTLGAVGAVTGIQIGGSSNNQTQTAPVPQGTEIVQPEDKTYTAAQKWVALVNSINPKLTVDHQVDTKNLTAGLPSWALPAGAALLAVMLLRGGGRR